MALETVEVCHVAIDVEEALRKWAPPYDIVLLDHDLGGEQMVASGQNTGYGFVTAASGFESCHRVIVHSWNPDGAANMLRALRAQGVSAVRHSFDRGLLAWCQGEACRGAR